MFTEKDIRELEQRGIALETALDQLAQLRDGKPFVRLNRACTIGDGIRRLKDAEIDAAIAAHRSAQAGGRISKFVPASGAATRMFKTLLEVLNNPAAPDWPTVLERAEKGDGDSRFIKKFITHLDKFAFFEHLAGLLEQRGESVAGLLSKGDYKTIFAALLQPDGLDYANLPKGLIEFHRRNGRSQSPFEEHLAESLAYVKDEQGTARIHFTISDDPAIQKRIRYHMAAAEKRLCGEAAQFEITYSIQKPSTDMLAADPDNRPFREADGRLHFRPGGHGALLENLNDLQGDIVFIKNIDNVVPQERNTDTIRYKMALGGYLVLLQQQIFKHLWQLERGNASAEDLAEIADFIENNLSVKISPTMRTANKKVLQKHLFELLNRPLRVCGMVQNQGEPGGGPFWVEDRHGNVSLQVVETAQIDIADPSQRKILQSATHFSPVDFVCGVRDFRGRPFDLHDYRDPHSGFVTLKSNNGQTLKALELPGLWNGGMAFWNSVFIEVPISTFNPVKTVLDLLRPAHQPL